MLTRIYNQTGAWLVSGANSEGTGSALDLRASNGHFYRYFSASGDGPTAGASAIFALQHSHDGVAWLTLETVTASAGQQGGAFYSAGAYGFVRPSLLKVYSAAQTGTGFVYLYVLPGQG